MILFGVFLAWWSKVWARARVDRDQALVPAVVMRTQLTALQQVIDQLPQGYRAALTNISAALTTLLGELSDATLDAHQFVPPKFPSPWGFNADSAGYKAYLEARNPRVQLLTALVRQGVVPAVAEDNGTLTAPQKAFVTGAVGNIDRIVTTAPLPTADQALAAIQPILTNLHTQLYPPVAPAPAPAPAPPPTAPQDYERLAIEMNTISKGVWLIYGILTTLAGLVVLILNNPGFGVPVDFIFAFFWGFGLPTTVAALTPSSAATALSISVAKSS